jgi:transglutaminase/protease-like cytokinesis protein 3
MEKPKYSMTKPNSHIFPRIQHSKDNKGKTPNTRKENIPEKKQENNPSINLKEDSRKNIIPSLTTKITGSNNYFSLISLNINGLNSQIKRHKLTEWLHKQDTTFCCLQETHLRKKDRHYLRVKGWKIFSKQMVRRNTLE